MVLVQTTEVLLWASIALLLLVLVRPGRVSAKTRQREQESRNTGLLFIYGPDGKLIALPEKLTEEAQRLARR